MIGEFPCDHVGCRTNTWTFPGGPQHVTVTHADDCPKKEPEGMVRVPADTYSFVVRGTEIWRGSRRELSALVESAVAYVTHREKFDPLLCDEERRLFRAVRAYVVSSSDKPTDTQAGDHA